MDIFVRTFLSWHMSVLFTAVAEACASSTPLAKVYVCQGQSGKSSCHTSTVLYAFYPDACGTTTYLVDNKHIDYIS